MLRRVVLGSVLSSILQLGLAAGSARAEVPGFLPLQGVLSDANGKPIEGNVSIVVALYTENDRESEKIVEETHPKVEVHGGAFSLYLGDRTRGGAGLDLDQLRQHGTLFAGLTVDGEPLEPLLQLGSVPFAAVAQYSENAATLDGKSASEFVSKTETVSWTQLSNVPASLLDGDADTLATLSCDEGAVPQRSSSGWTCGALEWTQLASVPPGFADGVDDDSGGDITQVSAGAGLSGGGTQGDVSLSIQPCAAGQILQYSNGWTCVTPNYLASTGGSVTGNVKAPGYELTNARTEYLSIPGLAFTGSGMMYQYMVARTGYGSLYFSADTPAGQEVWVAAPVYVPHGATITDVTCAFTNSSSSDDINGNIQGATDRSPGAPFKDWFEFHGDGASIVKGSTGKLELTVDMQNMAYYIEVYMMNAAGGDSFSRLSLNRCTVTYTRAQL